MVADDLGDDPERILLQMIDLVKETRRRPTTGLRTSNRDYARLARAGNHLQALGDYDAARHVYAAAQNLAREDGDPFTILYFTLQTVRPCVKLLEFSSASKILELALGEPVAGDDSRTDFIQRARSLGAPDADETDLDYLRCEAVYALATYWAATGALRAAEAGLAGAAELLRSQREPVLDADEVQLERAELCLDRGDLSAFDDLLAQAIANTKPNPAGANARSLVQRKWDVLAATAMTCRGSFTQARKALQRVIDENPASGPSAVREAALWQLTHVLSVLNDWNQASATARQLAAAGAPEPDVRLIDALLAARRLAPPHELGLPPTVADQVRGTPRGSDGRSRAMFGDFSARMRGAPPGSSATAEALAGDRALTGAQRTRVRLREEWAQRANRVQLHLHYHRIPEAARELEDLEILMSGVDSPALQARLSYLRSALGYYSGDYSTALTGSRQAADGFATLRMPAEEWTACRVHTWALRRTNTDADALRRSCRREQELMGAIRGLLTAEDWIGFSLNKASAIDEAISQRLRDLDGDRSGSRLAVDVLRDVANMRRCDDPSRPMPVTEAPPRHENGNVAQWAREQTRLRALSSAGRPALRDIVPGWLPRDTALFHYLVLPDRLELFVVTRRGATRLSSALSGRATTREFLRSRIGDVLRHVDDCRATGERGNPVSWSAEGGPLSDCAELLLLGEAIATLPRGIVRLAIVPDDALGTVPFAALPFDGRPLIARFSIRMLPELRWVGGEVGDAQSPGVGVGIVHSAARPEVAPLPSVTAEMKRLRQVLRRRLHTKLNARATCASVMEALSDAAFAHFACHGAFDPGDPAASGLLMWDRWLTIADLYARPLPRLRRVVAASCWMGDSAVLPGREIIGLPSALLHVGVAEVITCLWQVSDPFSPQFMADLYQRLRVMPCDLALSMTQREWWSKPDASRNANPWLWAGYVAHARGLAPASTLARLRLWWRGRTMHRV